MIHTIAVLYAVKHGLGRHVNDVLRTEGNYHLEKMSRVGFRILYSLSFSLFSLSLLPLHYWMEGMS